MHGDALQYALGDLKSDRIVVETAVRRYGHSFRFASDALRADREMALLAASKLNGYPVKHASAELLNDRDFAVEAAKLGSHSLLFMKTEFRFDRDLVLEVVKVNGSALSCVSNELKDDGEVVRAAVRSHGLALGHAGNKFRSDRQLVLEALRKRTMGFSALEYASGDLKRDRDVALAAVGASASALLQMSPELRKDREIVLKASTKHDFSLVDVEKEFLSDVEVVLNAVKRSNDELGFADEELHSDAFLLEWTALSRKERLARRAREIFVGHFVRAEREAKLKATVDLWLTKNELHDWVEACGREFKRGKKRRREEAGI